MPSESLVTIKSSPDNQKLCQLIDRILSAQQSAFSSDDMSQLKIDAASHAFSLASLTVISNFFQSSNSTEKLADYFIDTSAPSKLGFPAHNRPIPPNEELVKRRELLKLRAEAREYNRMVYGKEEDPRVAEIMNAGNHYSSARNQLAIAGNMVMSVVASFAISYYAGKSFKASNTTSLVCGLLGAIGILFVEMGLFIVRAMKVETVSDEDARKAEAAKLSSGLATEALNPGYLKSLAADSVGASSSPKESVAKKND